MFNWNFQSIATSTVQPFVAEYLRKECGDLNEVASDNDDERMMMMMPIVKTLKLLNSAQVKH